MTEAGSPSLASTPGVIPYVEGDIIGQVASLLLPPSGQSLRFEYATHYDKGVGSLTPDPAPQT